MHLIVYADETGTHDQRGNEPGSEVVGVVGYAARKEHWERFDKEWNRVLDCYQVPAFHMSEFVDERRGPKKKDWPYKGWSRAKRDEFITELVTAARDNTLFGVGGCIGVREYDEVVPKWLKEESKHPYYFALQLFVENVLGVLAESSPALLVP